MLSNKEKFIRRPSVWRSGAGWYALLLGVLLGANAQALTVTSRPFPELVREAEVIVVGTVAGLESAWSADRETIQTTVSLTDLELIKGEIPAVPYQLRLVGGVVGDTAQTYPGMPRLVAGGRYVLFVRGNLREFFPLVGAYQGLYRVLTDADGQQRVLRADRHDSPVVRAITLPAQPTLEEFTARIRDQMRAPERVSAP